MKTKIEFLGLLLWLAAGFVHAEVTNGVGHLGLDGSTVFRIPVALDRVTTVAFDLPISGLEGAFISEQPSLLARFQLSHQIGSRYFSVRALATNVTANLNVILGREICALELFESHHPLYVVEFARISPSKIPNQVAPPASPAAPKLARLPATVETAKNFARLRAENPEAASAIQYARPNNTCDYWNYSVRVEEVFRFDENDMIVLRAVFRNKTGSPLEYIPARSGLRVDGQEFYFTEFKGDHYLPAQTEVSMYLTLTGSASSGRDNLSATNTFVVFLGLYPKPVRTWTTAPDPVPLYSNQQTYATPIVYPQVVYPPVYPVYPPRVYYPAVWPAYPPVPTGIRFHYQAVPCPPIHAGKTFRFR